VAVGSQIGAFRMGKDSKPKKEKHSKHKKKGSKEKKAKKEKHSKQRRCPSSSPSSDSSSGSDGERLGVNKQLAMGRAAARATREILAYNQDLRKELREVRRRRRRRQQPAPKALLWRPWPVDHPAGLTWHYPELPSAAACAAAG
jgi:hypothetical protein